MYFFMTSAHVAKMTIFENNRLTIEPYNAMKTFDLNIANRILAYIPTNTFAKIGVVKADVGKWGGELGGETGSGKRDVVNSGLDKLGVRKAGLWKARILKWECFPGHTTTPAL